jgi:hypothetical protein
VVYVYTDADTHHGYNVTACQYDKHTGAMRPLLFISHGWIATQLKWKPQVKECYAQMQAATRIMPKYFPFARVKLLSDNANLKARRESDDLRVARWTADIEATGVEERVWIKGEWNSIADHGSRTVRPEPDSKLSAEEQFDMHIYSLVLSALPASSLPVPPSLAGEPDTGETPVPGHLTMAPMVAKIASAQDEVEATERVKWASKHYSRVVLGNRTIVLTETASSSLAEHQRFNKSSFEWRTTTQRTTRAQSAHCTTSSIKQGCTGRIWTQTSAST